MNRLFPPLRRLGIGLVALAPLGLLPPPDGFLPAWIGLAWPLLLTRLISRAEGLVGWEDFVSSLPLGIIAVVGVAYLSPSGPSGVLAVLASTLTGLGLTALAGTGLSRPFVAGLAGLALLALHCVAFALLPALTLAGGELILLALLGRAAWVRRPGRQEGI